MLQTPNDNDDDDGSDDDGSNAVREARAAGRVGCRSNEKDTADDNDSNHENEDNYDVSGDDDADHVW